MSGPGFCTFSVKMRFRLCNEQVRPRDTDETSFVINTLVGWHGGKPPRQRRPESRGHRGEHREQLLHHGSRLSFSLTERKAIEYLIGEVARICTRDIMSSLLPAAAH